MIIITLYVTVILWNNTMTRCRSTRINVPYLQSGAFYIVQYTIIITKSTMIKQITCTVLSGRWPFIHDIEERTQEWTGIRTGRFYHKQPDLFPFFYQNHHKVCWSTREVKRSTRKINDVAGLIFYYVLTQRVNIWREFLCLPLLCYYFSRFILKTVSWKRKQVRRQKSRKYLSFYYWTTNINCGYWRRVTYLLS